MEDFIAQWFTPEKVAMYLSWVAYIGTIVGLVANIKKLKQSNNLTLKNVSDEVRKLMESEIKQAVSGENQKYLPNVLKTQEQMSAIMQSFAKILALSQENTPESRVAILNVISDLGLVGQELVENAKVVVEDEVKSYEEHKENVDKALDEIIDKYDGTTI